MSTKAGVKRFPPTGSRAPAFALLRRRLASAEVLLDWLPRRALLQGRPRIIANGLPKAGTNLLIKALTTVARMHRSRRAIHGQTPTRERAGQVVPIGVDTPRAVPLSEVRNRLRWVAPGSVVSAHLPDSGVARELLDELGYRMALIVRDPRDVAVSFADFVSNLPAHWLHERFAAAPADQRLLWAIDGIPGELDDIATRTRRVTGWRTWPAAHVVRFEDLIGPSGGGDAQVQAESLMALVAHSDATVSLEAATAAGPRLFGGTRTFRRGQLGGWREHFEPVHIARMKELAGDLLVELGYETDGAW